MNASIGRPTAVIALAPAVAPDLLRPPHLERLRGLCDVPDPEV